MAGHLLSKPILEGNVTHFLTFQLLYFVLLHVGAYPDGGKHDHVIALLAVLGPGRLNQILRLGLDQYSRYCIELIFQVMD